MGTERGQYILESIKADADGFEAMCAAAKRIFEAWEDMDRPSGEFMVEFAQRKKAD